MRPIIEEERVQTGRLARIGSILFLLLAVTACSSSATSRPTASLRPMASATPSPRLVTSSAGPATPSPIPTTRPWGSPRSMTPATLKPGPAMTVARAGQATVRLGDGRVLIMGGSVPRTSKCPMMCEPPATASVEIYDPSTGKFSPNGSLAAPRTGGDAVLLDDGRVLVSGGYGEDAGWLNTIEIYDPATGTSAVVPGTQELPVYSTVLLLADGKVLIAGGSYDNCYTTSDATLIFDPASGGLSAGPQMAKPRQGAMATLLNDGRVLLAGGAYCIGYLTYMNDNAELIDPSHPLSRSTLLVSPDPTTSTLLSDGRILVTDTGAGCMTPAVSEIFDPGTEKFTPVGPMSTPRSGSTAIKIQDGRVLFIGGEMNSTCVVVDTVEAFDPDSGTFQVIATGFPDLSGFSATLLDDGEILIAGGSGSGDWNYSMTAASWFIKP